MDSRVENILQAMIDGSTVGELVPPRSRVEALLLELKDVIENLDPDIPQEELEAIVNAWLEDHPEVTTTVQDGSITKAKLDNNLQGTVDDVTELKSATDVLTENALIVAETAQGYSHEDLNTPQSITFVGNELAFGTAKYASEKNCAIGSTINRTVKGVELVGNGNFIVYNGTATTGDTSTGDDLSYYLDTPLPAGDYIWILKFSEAHKGSLFRIGGYYEGSSESVVLRGVWPEDTATEVMLTFTAEYPIKRWHYVWGVAGDTTYNNFKIWFGVYPASTVITDTELTIASDATVEYTDNELSSITTVDTMQHESTVRYIVETKEYVDNHIPDIKAYWTDEIYVLPEKFGAVGDGVTDDSVALSDCLAYAKANGKAVRGYRKYKTSESVVLDWEYADVYLREISYTGNESAVEIQNQHITFDFHRIVSSNAGVNFSHTSNKSAYARECKLTGNEINCSGNCISAQPKTLYNVCDIKRLWSSNGSCIAFVNVTIHTINELGFPAGEYVFHNCKCHCPNGYVGKYVNATKMYSFTVEADCKYGLLEPRYCECYGWRHIEQVDGMWHRITGSSEYNNGPLIIFDTPSEDLYGKGYHNLIYQSTNNLPWYAIDATAIQGFDEITASEGESLTDKWLRLGYTGVSLGTPVCGNGGSQCAIIGADTYIIGDNIVHAPGERMISHINSECDFRVLDSREDSDIIAGEYIVLHMGTDFIIDTPHADIYFNASFGAVGYNDLTVTQHDGNTCTIYDKLGNVLFDGTNEGDGKWSLKCAIDLLAPNRAQGTVSWKCYDGTNEVWEITKIS